MNRSDEWENTSNLRLITITANIITIAIFVGNLSLARKTAKNGAGLALAQ